MEGLYFVFVVCGAALFAFLITRVCIFTQEIKSNKVKAEHPWYFATLEKLNAMHKEEIHFYNANISPLKSAINRILKDWNYYPVCEREEKNVEIEALRCMLHQVEEEYKEMRKKSRALRKELRDYALNVKELKEGWEY